MGRSQREKGKRWEREVAELMRPIYPDAHRGQQSRLGSDDSDVVAVGPWWVECKHRARNVSPIAALQQATEAMHANNSSNEAACMSAVAVCKTDRARPTATMWLDDWLELVKEWKERGGRHDPGTRANASPRPPPPLRRP